MLYDRARITASDTTGDDYIVCSSGTAGSLIAARLAEFRDVSVLLIEASQYNSLLENTQVAGRYVNYIEFLSFATTH
ncbi:hypothetical protein B9Z19DRAFT_52344 [Tuber borchii]|uniref:Uncharacterized protein n=1 Tax=Tuber borchii TaxID=42251 RepID=A0A2T7A6Z2_TUBBO|nr:hypothetical protein B9Z19DRAFT_52344 [Tuber borchii]